MAITTLMCATAKVEFMSGAHCFNASSTTTASSTSSTAYTSVGSVVGLAVGQPFTGTNVGAGSVIAAITSATTFTSSVASTGTITGGTLTFTGDVFKITLIKAAAATTYDSTFVNVGVPGTGSPTTTNLGTDEVAASGAYVAGGQILANNTTAVLGGSAPQIAFTTWSVNPTWAASTISAIGCIIYNNSVRLGGATNFGGGRALGVFDFGGTQTVTAGTFTVLLPSAASTTAILRIS